jgi:hypothetical protein
MNSQEIDNALRELKNQGYAIVLFTPEELEGAEADRVEDRLIELGWEVIFDLKPLDNEEEDTI